MGDTSDTGLRYQWRWLVTNYAKRALTKETYILPALAGLARKFGRRSNLGRYVAGIWTGDLPDSLLWVRDKGRVPASKYLAPSWSWAPMLTGNLQYPGCLMRSFNEGQHKSIIHQSKIKILDITCDHSNSDGDLFGAVIGGHLTVSGFLVESTLSITHTISHKGKWLRANCVVTSKHGLGAIQSVAISLSETRKTHQKRLKVTLFF
jgi:hypothetical protein